MLICIPTLTKAVIFYPSYWPSKSKPICIFIGYSNLYIPPANGNNIFHSISVHIGKRGRSPENYDLDRLATVCEGHVGSEIEQAVIEAMYQAFNDPAQPAREFTGDDIAAAMTRMVPLSRSQKEMIEYLRRWLTEGRAQSASYQVSEQTGSSFVPIPIEPLVEA